MKVKPIELNGLDDGNGIQITLFPGSAAITVPYWHTGRAAEAVFREMWQYATIIEREAGYSTYDPQLGHVLDLAADFSSALRLYSHTLTAVSENLAVSRPKPRHKWWQFWRR